ncbi:MAG TPA: GGDEF domain-containing protein [Dissulfurispiraceae bacterium]|nr:GGDEF domain-containing protein [Dissulfurispiraceae bacterium]
MRDELTGLYNRRGFLALAEQQRKTANRLNKGLVLIYCDLDDMKKINDTLGHREGDRALGDAAKLLRMSVRESDVVARIGGDEFAILAMDVDDVDAQEIIARLQDNIHHFNETAGRPFVISLSTGLSVFDDDRYRCIDEMLAHADGVMYQEKKRKRMIHARGISRRSGIH